MNLMYFDHNLKKYMWFYTKMYYLHIPWLGFEARSKYVVKVSPQFMHTLGSSENMIFFHWISFTFTVNVIVSRY